MLIFVNRLPILAKRKKKYWLILVNKYLQLSGLIAIKTKFSIWEFVKLFAKMLKSYNF